MEICPFVVLDGYRRATSHAPFWRSPKEASSDIYLSVRNGVSSIFSKKRASYGKIYLFDWFKRIMSIWVSIWGIDIKRHIPKNIPFRDLDRRTLSWWQHSISLFSCSISNEMKRQISTNVYFQFFNASNKLVWFLASLSSSSSSSSLALHLRIIQICFLSAHLFFKSAPLRYLFMHAYNIALS